MNVGIYGTDARILVKFTSPSEASQRPREEGDNSGSPHQFQPLPQLTAVPMKLVNFLNRDARSRGKARFHFSRDKGYESPSSVFFSESEAARSTFFSSVRATDEFYSSSSSDDLFFTSQPKHARPHYSSPRRSADCQSDALSVRRSFTSSLLRNMIGKAENLVRSKATASACGEEEWSEKASSQWYACDMPAGIFCSASACVKCSAPRRH
eukprot:5439915-Pleurochrysis_carterae.AAC.2